MKLKKVLLILSLVISAICVPWFLLSHILVIGWFGFFPLAYADIILLHMALAEKDYSSIVIQVSYNYNANAARFDGIQLFKEEFGSSYGYDEDGNITSITDILGKKTKYTYNDDQELTKEELPSGLVYHHSYDTYHNLTKTITAEGDTKVQTKNYTYDDYGNLTLEKTKEYNVDAPITTVSYAYSADFNRLESVTDDTGKTTHYEYDADTNMLKSVKCPQNTDTTKINYSYDNMFRQTGVTAQTNTGLNLSAAYTYSEEDYLTKIQTPTTAYSFTYGDFGLRKTVKAGNHLLASYTYKGEANSSNDADRNYYLETLDYGNGDQVKYTYDKQGRVLSQIYEDNSSVTYTYNNSGALAKVYDSATETTTTYYYDFLDRTMKYVESSANLTHSVGYEYDELNRMSALVETINGAEHKTEYTYDEHSRVKTVTDGIVTKANTYDVFERLSQQTTSYPTQEEVDGVTQETTFTVKTDSFTFTSPEQNYTSGQIASHTIDAASYDVTYTYTYDGNGNILSISDGVNTTSYVYDSANQLVRENNQAGNFTHTWTYDNAGNILNRKEYAYNTGTLGTPIDTISYTYGDTSWGDLLTSFDGNTITYDAIGNPLSDGTWVYSWEHGRQLVSMSEDNTTWNFTYNAGGIRTKRTNGTTTYQYIYNGDKLTKMTVGNDVLYFSYDTSGQPLSVSHNGTTYYYVINIQGDVIGMLDESGAQVVSYVYDAWGNHLSTTGILAATLGQINPLRYRSYVFDFETGLYYLQTRYYNPEISRFINLDIQLCVNQGMVGINVFSYCINRPVTKYDKNGKEPGDVFETLEMARWDALNYIGKYSFATGWEYAAIIYKVPAKYERVYTTESYEIDGKRYTYTAITYEMVQAAYYSYRVVTSKDPVSVSIPEEPAGTIMQEVLHTHPYCEGYLPDQFSEGDMGVSDNYDVPIYLYGADGTYAKYDDITNSLELFIGIYLPPDPNFPD